MPVFLSESSPSLYGFFLDFSPLPLPLPLLFVMILVEERKTGSGREHVVVENESERERVWSLCARKVYFRGEYFDGGIGE
jgi:hypothetical protein